MTKYWCVNFMNVHVLKYGIKESLWLMGYQYEEDSPQWNGMDIVIEDSRLRQAARVASHLVLVRM